MVVSDDKPAEISDVAMSESVEAVAFDPERNYLSFVQPSRSARDVQQSGKPAVRYVAKNVKNLHYRSRHYD